MPSLRLEGKVLLTGGTGTFGRAILSRAERENWPCTFTIYSRDEVKQAELASQYPRHRFILGDVREANWLTQCAREHDLIIHAAAYKRIDSAEHNVTGVISTNIIGSLNVAMAAVEVGVPRAICLSSDKACMPINLYGATKMAMERIFQRANSWGDTAFHLVRYGNILGSRGSVVPLFIQQARAGGPLTITDERMTRFWHTIDEGIDLALCSLWKPRGTILVPRARSMRVVELAEVIAPDVARVEVGIRPGEKLHETLVCRAESPRTEECTHGFLIWPYGTEQGGMASFEYGSDNAPKISKDEMKAILEGEGCIPFT